MDTLVLLEVIMGFREKVLVFSGQNERSLVCLGLVLLGSFSLSIFFISPSLPHRTARCSLEDRCTPPRSSPGRHQTDAARHGPCSRHGY